MVQFVNNNQALATLPGDGVGQNLITLAPCAINQPHVHPRGTEIVHITKGKPCSSLILSAQVVCCTWHHLETSSLYALHLPTQWPVEPALLDAADKPSFWTLICMSSTIAKDSPCSPSTDECMVQVKCCLGSLKKMRTGPTLQEAGSSMPLWPLANPSSFHKVRFQD